MIEKLVFLIIGDLGDFFAVAGFLYCYMNRVMTFVNDSKRYNWTFIFPALYIFVVLLELTVAVGLIKRTVYVTLVYSAVSGLAVLTGLYYHVWFSTIIYNKLVEYKTNSLSISFITSITSVFIIIASTLAALNIVNYDFVYLAASLDMSAFMICNSVLIRASKNIKLENEDVMFDSNRASSICQNSRKSIQIEQKKSVVVERGNAILRSKTVQTKPNNSGAGVILEISKISVKPENDT